MELHDIKRSMAQREKRIARLSEETRCLIEKQTGLERVFQWLTGLKGIAETSALARMGELLRLPPGLSPRAGVKFVGIDPRTFESGKSVRPQARLVKVGKSVSQ